ncbi:hypothetical protein F6X40_34580 [Paraburkholderia sp. UCT31]|uniref:hypothetical protein n=1 Tax=Paraburkholderia sp. UCT31 TaxID=2615209 RepID=UPI00165635F3|nr:hypothetical protein [Paraburkholderia sp. UCT31]MBC8741690.1 hypothetical protein [Paraburkholderia sp. UCT31]
MPNTQSCFPLEGPDGAGGTRILVENAVEVLLFDTPSGDIRGTVLGFGLFKGKGKRIAHAYIPVEGEPKISLDVPKAVTVEDIARIGGVLALFVEKLNDACAKFGSGDSATVGDEKAPQAVPGKDRCPACGHNWDAHDFGVPRPYCP